jgi:hypothetical protein
MREGSENSVVPSFGWGTCDMGRQVVSIRRVSIIRNLDLSVDVASIRMGTMLVVVAILWWNSWGGRGGKRRGRCCQACCVEMGRVVARDMLCCYSLLLLARTSSIE